MSNHPTSFSPELLPTDYAKRILIEFATSFFRENTVYKVTDGEPEGETVGRDSLGNLIAKTGDHPMFIRDTWGRDDSADLSMGIIVQRQGFGWQGKSIGQKLQAIRKLTPDDRILQGQEFMDTIPIPVTAWCVSKNGVEADRIASTLTLALHACRLILPGQYAGLRDILGVQCGTETPVKRPTTREVLAGVPVNVTFEIRYLWRVFDLRGSTARGTTIQVAGDPESKLTITTERR